MADSIFHLKDAYYFEIPKKFWKYDFQTEADVPEFLVKEAHGADLHPTLDEYEEALHGKVLIPQPFGTIKNFYERESGFCISKMMILELVIAALLVVVFSRVAAGIKQGAAPKGKLTNLFETLLVYFRDNVARSAIGHHDGDRFVPLLWTLFFFILFCNLCGLIPFLGTATGVWSVTAALAAVTLVTVVGSGMLKMGVVGFFKNMLPPIDMPWWLLPMKYIILVVLLAIESVSLLIKHAILSVRLMANMVAGHLVLLAVLGMAVKAGESFNLGASGTGSYGLVAVISVIGSVCLCCLEVFVALLQAYVFTFLSALFIGSAVHSHH